MLKKMIMLGASALLAVNATASETPIHDQVEIVWSPIITLSGGVLWASPGQNQYLYPYAIPQYQYYTFNSPTNAAGSGELFFGLQHLAFSNVVGELGIGVAGVSDMDIDGNTEVNGALDAYSFAYKVNSARVELKGRLIANTSPAYYKNTNFFNAIQPYVSASVGAAFNNSHDYRPVWNNTLQAQPVWFASYTALGFAYSLGAGIQTSLTPNWQFGVGYQFTDLGKSSLNGDNVLLTKGIQLTHLYTNELVFNLSYAFS